MRLLDVRLKNYRCFGDLHLNLQGMFTPDGDRRQLYRGGVAVLVAPNGKGKTAILDGIKYLLASFIARFKNVKTPAPKDSDFRREWFFENSGNVREKFTAPYMRFAATAEFPSYIADQLSGQGRLATWDITRLRDKSNTTKGMVPSGKALGELYSVADMFIDGDSNDAPQNLPILAYYNTERAVVRKKPERRRDFRKVFRRTDAYVGALDGGLDYKGLIEWMCYVEEKQKSELVQRRDFNYVSLEEKTIQKAVEGLLPGFSNLRVTYSPLNLVVDVKDGGVVKTCSIDEQLSDGYKIVLVLALNLVSRILEANGELPDATPESLLSSDGIVLIDEIDLHLHPSWQQRIVGDLTRTFPNIQFIVTTHSPQVVSSVKGSSVFLVNDGDMEVLGTARQTRGLDANQLLTDVFGSSFAAECKEREELEEYARRLELSDKLTAEDEEMFKELEKYFGEDDPVIELLRFRRDLIRRGVVEESHNA